MKAIAYFLVLATGLVSAEEIKAQAISSADAKFFEAKIRPVLVKHCYECHSAQSGKTKGGLKVDSRDALLAGGETGPAIVPRSLQKKPAV